MDGDDQNNHNLLFINLSLTLILTTESNAFCICHLIYILLHSYIYFHSDIKWQKFLPKNKYIKHILGSGTQFQILLKSVVIFLFPFVSSVSAILPLSYLSLFLSLFLSTIYMHSLTRIFFFYLFDNKAVTQILDSFVSYSCALVKTQMLYKMCYGLYSMRPNKNQVGKPHISLGEKGKQTGRWVWTG